VWNENKSVQVTNTIFKTSNATDLQLQQKEGHIIHTIQSQKVGLDNWSDKRYRLNKTDTLPFGLDPYNMKNKLYKISTRTIEQRFENAMSQRAKDKGLELNMSLLGCTMEEFKTHIGKQFKVGM